MFFVNNLYLNHTNVCRVKCKFCAFAVTGKQPDAYTWEIDELVDHAVDVYGREGYSEIHMVGGENPHLDYGYYIDLTRALHEALPDVHLKLFTASEIHHMHQALGAAAASEILADLKEAGLGSLPGGGAEVFADRVRKLIAPGQGASRQLDRHPPGRPRHGHPHPLHDALRPRRELRGAGRPLAAAARPAGRDRRLPGLHPAAVPSPRTPSSSGAAGASRPATTTSR